MAFVLEKYSSPGWEKEYQTKDELIYELRRHICPSCLVGPFIYVGEGGKLVENEEHDYVVDVEYQGKFYPCRDIGTLLSTACGCEYGVEIDGRPYWSD